MQDTPYGDCFVVLHNLTYEIPKLVLQPLQWKIRQFLCLLPPPDC